MNAQPWIAGTWTGTVNATIERACDSADRVLLRGASSGNAFLAPTLVEHGDPKAFFCQEEIFRPFVTLENFEDEA